MTILVKVEDNKTTDEIRHLNLMRDCQRVRSKERWYKRIFYGLFILVLLSSGYFLYLGFFLSYELYIHIYAGYHLIIFAFETSMFLWIYWLLVNKHHYEFQRNKNSIRIQFVLALIYHFSVFFNNFRYLVVKFMTGLLAWEYILMIALIFMHLPPILFCLQFLALIKVKSHIDIL